MNVQLPDPVTLIAVLGALALVPFIALMVTSFVKIAVVLTLVRNALGVQQIPPNSAIYGLAIILTIYVMAPIGVSAYDSLRSKELSLSNREQLMSDVAEAALPFKAFLDKRVKADQKDFFLRTTRTMWPKELADQVGPDSYLILVPAFTVSELTSAFEIGFLLYLPFIVIDLIVSNILLAMGMMMVSPLTISLPFKLFLFVMIDGWSRLIHGLVLTYQ
ncbi:MAG: type III secretion system export apparatus subunit SctR [Alphaproteobacteria bacterium]|nr:type III secretion system export apparatus subunit SctR [Alphaproteobacteria bacterium]